MDEPGGEVCAHKSGEDKKNKTEKKIFFDNNSSLFIY
jgi:hypothetical protein